MRQAWASSRYTAVLPLPVMPKRRCAKGRFLSAGKGVHLRAVFPERGQLFLRELEGRLWRRQQRFLWFRLVLFGRGGAKFHQLVLHQCRERLRAVGQGFAQLSARHRAVSEQPVEQFALLHGVGAAPATADRRPVRKVLRRRRLRPA